MIKTVIDENLNENLRFLEFGSTSPKIGYGWGPGARDYYMIHILISGKGYFNGQLVEPGQFFMSKPHQEIHYYPKKDTPWNYFWILFDGTCAKDFLLKYNMYPENGVGNFYGLKELKQLIKNLFKTSDSIDNETATNFAKQIFSCNINPQKKPDVKQIHLLNSLEFIKRKYNEGISPIDVANFVGLDEKYLYSIFNSYLNLSVQKYLNNLRIEKAKSLLENSKLNISEISYSIGIAEPLNFSRFFKKIVGVSPKKYRESFK